MYAVIETGGKQYRVEVGTELEIERLEAENGATVDFDRVLLIADGDTAAIGTPVVANGSVAGEILRRDRGEKLISFKYRPKARRRVKKGHRQELTVVRISDIVLDGKSAAKEVAAADRERQTERQRLEQAARRQAEQDAALAAKLAAEKPAKAETKTPTKSDAKTETKTTARRGAAKADTTETADKKTTARKTSSKSDTASKTSSARKSNKD
jgi:large subunit ribosomal protein L21